MLTLISRTVQDFPGLYSNFFEKAKQIFCNHCNARAFGEHNQLHLYIFPNKLVLYKLADVIQKLYELEKEQNHDTRKFAYETITNQLKSLRFTNRQLSNHPSE